MSSIDRNRGDHLAERIEQAVHKPTLVEDGEKTHESCLRAYHVLSVTKVMLKDGVPPDWVLAMIYTMEGKWRSDVGN